ncbi:MAG: hypothetical protein KJS95_05515 [Gammaproteobacteria bacterium]|nr:hypothetical protein [Gammaproteobacteria bacterium]
MYSLMFLGFAIAQASLFVWALRLWRETRARALPVIIVPLFFLIWDNLRVAAGIVIGFGDTLYWLTWPVFWAHWLSGCWLIIASGSILRLAGFGFANSRAVMAAFCIVTAALVLHDLPLFWTRDIYPVCEFDLIRYSGSVTEANRCFPDQPLVKGEFPIAPVVTCFVVIGTGIALWVRRGFPWMAVGGIVMLLTAAIPALSRHRLDNLGEVFIKGGSILAVWFLTRRAANATRG